ncbi:hypothetical protein ABFS82_13G118800 [Erythranthe guttata]|nr:PREDICTED: (E,E)-alpha-farnesene synthase-like [Erythranthe guttata]|eukprot:XP_012848754.1 PREDICTED: (E,E)-alpha-farnesene synthase-like [Erythranthe guttata]
MNMESAVDNFARRRTANYKPNIWSYDNLLHSLITTQYSEDKYRREAETLKEEIRGIIVGRRVSLSLSEDPLILISNLELIDEINKLAISYCFEKEISESLEGMARYTKSTKFVDLYSAALYFRILRQHGYHVSQDAILELLDDHDEKLSMTRARDSEYCDKAIAEIFEASHLALDGENGLFDIIASYFSGLNSNDDDMDDKSYSDKCPSHWSVAWFNAKKHIHVSNNNNKSTLHRLARLSFNMVQIHHQKDLKVILRWWRNLGLTEVLTFTRDRAVESFLWAVGVAYEPRYGSLRKWLTKSIILVLIIDDVYDIYGTNRELHQFTTAVEKWDPMEVQHLPEPIKRCFSALYDTAYDIDREIQKEKGWNSVLPYLKKVWTDFCKALLVEAKWYNKGHTPSLGEYLENGWISSSGPVLSLHLLFGVGHDFAQTLLAFNTNQELIRHASLVIRLCNDQGTSKAEGERGDAPSSIICYMREENVTEEEARSRIKNIITDSWKKINGLFINTTPNSQKQIIKYIVNIARVANFIYQNGDGFGVQDRETKEQVFSCLIQPLPLP